MRGRSDSAAQKRRVFITVCTLALTLSLISLYHGSFFSNRKSKADVGTFDATSDWAVSTAADGKRGSMIARADKAEAEGTRDEQGETKDENDNANGDKAGDSETEHPEDDDTPKSFAVSTWEFFVL